MQKFTSGGSVEKKEIVDLLENWAGWLRGSVGLVRSASCSSLYMSPEEKAAAGRSCREARWNEADGMRVEAILAVMNQVPSQQFFVRMIKSHYFLKKDPRGVCRAERLIYKDYDHHVMRAVDVFGGVWFENRLTATKMLRYSSLNNLSPLRRDSSPSRRLSHV